MPAITAYGFLDFHIDPIPKTLVIEAAAQRSEGC